MRSTLDKHLAPFVPNIFIQIFDGVSEDYMDILC